jgi:hypothetical protein
MVDLSEVPTVDARQAGQTFSIVKLPTLCDFPDILDAFGRAWMAIAKRLNAVITAAFVQALVLPVDYQPNVEGVLSETGIAPQSNSLETLQTPDIDTGPALAQADAHGARLRAETRELALTAIRDLLPGAGGEQA